MSQLTPTQVFVAFAQALQDVCGHSRTVAPVQTPLTPEEWAKLEERVNAFFSMNRGSHERNGTA